MKPERDLRDLEVIGYANVLNANMVPSVVPPIFQSKSDPAKFVLPPYSIVAGSVRNGVEVGVEELMALRAAEEISLFDGQLPFDAQPGFELWVDPSFAVHYEPAGSVKSRLNRLAEEHIELAKEALRRDQLDQALAYGGVAISANDRRIEPLVIRAAISRLRHDLVEEQLMAEMAASALTRESFEVLVAQYVAIASQPAPVHPGVFSLSPTRGMAALR